MITLVLNFFSVYLIEFMGALLTVSLVFRYLAYRNSKSDDVYFSTFTRELESIIDLEKEQKEPIGDIDTYLSKVLGSVAKKLPSRSLRFGGKEKKEVETEKSRVVSFKEYMNGKQGLMLNIQAESNVFSCATPPNFQELAHRIMSQDKNWTTIMKHIPIDSVSRMIDITPGLFVVFGVFGTFIGISMALPEIAKIDFNNLEASGVILNKFVLNTTYAMKTSIAGIFFSLILTVLNTLFPIKEKRHWTFKKVESSLEMLWYHIQRDSSEGQKIEDVMPKLLKAVENIESFMKEKNSEKKAS